MQRNPPSLDRQRLTMLAEKLAVALCYLSAIDDSVDPFADQNPEEGWAVVALVAAAKKAILDSVAAGYIDAETELLVQGATQKRDIGLMDTPLYHECLNAVRLLVRTVQ